MKKTPKPKPLFLERMKTILKGDYEKYLEYIKKVKFVIQTTNK